MSQEISPTGDLNREDQCLPVLKLYTGCCSSAMQKQCIFLTRDWRWYLQVLEMK